LIHLREKAKITGLLIINIVHPISLINYVTHQIFRTNFRQTFWTLQLNMRPLCSVQGTPVLVVHVDLKNFMVLRSWCE